MLSVHQMEFASPKDDMIMGSAAIAGVCCVMWWNILLMRVSRRLLCILMPSIFPLLVATDGPSPEAVLFPG